MSKLAKLFIVSILILIDVFIFSKVISEKDKGRVLGIFISVTPTPTPSLTPTPTPVPTEMPTPTPSPTPSPIPTPTPIPPPRFKSEEVHSFIERFAAQYSVDPNVLRYIAVCESGFNPYAKNGPYLGLYQFSVPTWKSNREIMGEDTDPILRLNAEEATQTAAYLISIGKTWVWPNCYP